MNEVIVITGARGTGKSTLAATFLPPSEVGKAFVHDSENSMNNIVAQLAASDLAFGHYVDLKARFSNLPSDDDLLTHINAGKLPWTSKETKGSLADYYLYILDDLERNLTPGKYSLYIHDTLEKLEAGMVAWVESNRKQAGVTTLAFGKLWTTGVYPLYEHFLSSIFGRGVETIILCSHLKNPWSGNRPVVGKVAPSGKKILYKLSSLMLWLVNDRRNADGAPAALVLKERMGAIRVVNKDWGLSRMLPERIPHCTWADIRRYLSEGCDLSNPAEGEAMTKAEKGMISELLTDEQMRLMILDAEKELEEAKSHGALFVQQEPPKPEVDIKALVAEGKSVEEIAAIVNKPPQVVRAMIAGGKV
jgi:energy-coupling factor transporter ATP-binding protein EcfA2